VVGVLRRNTRTTRKGLLVAIPYGHLAEYTSRKKLLFVNLVSMLSAQVYAVPICENIIVPSQRGVDHADLSPNPSGYFSHIFNIKLVWLTALFNFVGGGGPVFYTFTHSIIAELVPSEELSAVYYKLSATILLAQVVGSALGSYLLQKGIWIPITIGFVITNLTIPMLAFLRDPRDAQKYQTVAATDNEEDITPRTSSASGKAPGPNIEEPPKLETAHTPGSATPLIDSANTASRTPSSAHVAFISFKTSVFDSLRTLRTAVVRDKFYRFLLGVWFLNALAKSVKILLHQWASKRFGWTLAQVGMLMSMETLLNAIILMALPLLYRYLTERAQLMKEWIDIWVVRWSLLVTVIGLISVGLSSTGFGFLIGLAVAAFGVGFTDALKSYVTGLVRQEDITLLYSCATTVETGAELVSGPMWAGLFSVGLSIGGVGGSLPFLCSGVLVFFSGFVLYGMELTGSPRRSLGGHS